MEKNFILRRNHWGEESCKYVQSAFADFENQDGSDLIQIINKDKQKIPTAEWCVRWATTSDVPHSTKVINKASAIHTVFMKGKFRQILSDHGLAPRTVCNAKPLPDMYPVVLRPMNHSKSMDLYICENEKSYLSSLEEMKKDFQTNEENFPGWYSSEFIDKDREIRVFVVSGRVVAMLEKVPTNKDDVSWGCVGAGKFNYIKWSNWPIDAARVACESFRYSGLDFGAVDIMMTGKKAWCLEINTGPEVSEYYGYCLGMGIRWIIENNNRNYLEKGNTKDFRSWIHPGIKDSNAVLAEVA